MPAEPVITPQLVRRLLQEQHPDLAGLRVGESIQGWDNTMVRLGPDLALRLPRHSMGERLLGQEIRWLPKLQRQTGVSVPAAVRTGQPVCGDRMNGYPFRWAVVPWTPGRCAAELNPEARDGYAPALAQLLAALHVTAPDDAPISPVGRGQGIDAIHERIQERLTARSDELGADRRRRLDGLIRAALSAPPPAGPPLWLHGDPHPRNTVLTRETTRVSGRPLLVDFGDLCAGDPASDLGQAWDHFTPTGRSRFRTAYGQARALTTEQDRALWIRARGWAVHYALIYLDPQRPVELHRAGRRMIGVLCCL